MLVDLSYNLDDIAPAENNSSSPSRYVESYKLVVCGKMIFWSSYRNK